jgi:hypothetical protein
MTRRVPRTVVALTAVALTAVALTAVAILLGLKGSGFRAQRMSMVDSSSCRLVAVEGETQDYHNQMDG